MDRDDLTARLERVFAAELEEHVLALNDELLALEARPDDPDLLRTVFRRFHSLKGAAAAAGSREVETLCHRVEDDLARIREGSGRLGDEDLQALFSAVDTLARARGGKVPQEPAAPAAPAGEKAAPPTDTRAAAPTGTAREGGDGSGWLRVDPAALDRAVAAADVLLAAGRQMANRAAELHRLGRSLDHVRGRAPARSSGGVESQGTESWREEEREAPDLETLARGLGELSSGLRRDARQLSRGVTELAVRMQEIRLRPFEEACQALPRAVRDIAAAKGKSVELRVEGGDVRVDREVLDILSEALLPLVRNAVDHGIEPPAVRKAAGKAPTGAVVVSAALEAGRLVVRVTDDGRGVDLPYLRERMTAEGREVPDDDATLLHLLLQGGVTTREKADHVSGRGVGLDIVRRAVERVRGSVEMESRSSSGTTTIIRCPPSLLTSRVLLVQVGDHVLALPIAAVQRVDRIGEDGPRTVRGRPAAPSPNGPPVPLAHLSAVLGPPFRAGSLSRRAPYVVLGRGPREAAVAVDALLRELQVVVRPLPPPADQGPLAVGTALLETGRVALILNPEEVCRRVQSGVAVEQEPTADRDTSDAPCVLVVDDSVTTRTLEQGVLEAAGYRVIAAPDGAEAWRLVQEERFDLVLSDVDMPRMDGFDLTRAIRASRRHADLPVVLVSALESEGDRLKGMEAGADAYLGKSTFDQERLLEVIRRLIGRGGAS